MLDYCLIPNNCERSFYAKEILKESGIYIDNAVDSCFCQFGFSYDS